MKSKPIKVLVCRVGRRPVVEMLNSDEQGYYLDAMQAICGGLVRVLTLPDGVELWCNEEADMLDLPINRVIDAGVVAPVPTELFGSPADHIYEDELEHYKGPPLARPGQRGFWQIRGDFFLCNHARGDLSDVLDEEVIKYTALFDAEDIAAAKRMNDRMCELRKAGVVP